ncbi:hypothetical protein ACET3Z_017140 [Daucus carota]
MFSLQNSTKGLVPGSFDQVNKSKNDDSHITVAGIFIYFEWSDSETQLLTIKFGWNVVMRSVSSTLVGVSLEFEIATNCVSTWAMRTIL